MLNQPTSKSSTDNQVPSVGTIRNWRKFQHYKNRNPLWIKLHKALLDDPEWHALDPLASKVLAMCWLVASESLGILPSLHKLSFRLRMPPSALSAVLLNLSNWIELSDSNLLATCKQDASKMLADGYQLAMPEERREDKEDKKEEDYLCPKSPPSDHVNGSKVRKTIDYSPEFQRFWELYPDRRNNSKPAAYAQWQKLSEPDRDLAVKSISAFAAFCAKNTDYRVVHCERYLSQRRFEGWVVAEMPRGRIRTA